MPVSLLLAKPFPLSLWISLHNCCNKYTKDSNRFVTDYICVLENLFLCNNCIANSKFYAKIKGKDKINYLLINNHDFMINTENMLK